MSSRPLRIGILVAAGIAALWLAWHFGLRPSSGAGAGLEAASSAAKPTRFHCPMHPTIISDHPGNCPICGMSLVLTDEDRDAVDTHSAAEPEGVPGLASVRLSPRKRQLIGVKTSEVIRHPFRRVVRAVGRVTYDETRLATVSVKTAGWIEVLHADATGMPIRKGQPLFEIYSPDLLVSQQEYLLALRTRARTANSAVPSVAESGEALVASARRKLELLDVSDAEIVQLEATGVPRRRVTVTSPASGVLLGRSITSGDRVEAGSNVLDLVDLSRVWVLASIYEYELPFLREGAHATMTLSYVPGKSWEGRVTFVSPVLDPATRTVQARLEFPNPGLTLKPEMFAEVELEAELGERLAVPAGAVLETGTRSVVFVAREEGLFDPREVRIGLRMPDLYEVLDGLVAGERVVTSGNFLVDSESKLAAALAEMDADAPAHEHQP